MGGSLDATFFTGSAAVMRDGRTVFDRFDVQSSRLQGGDGTFSATAWTFDTNVNFFHPELDGFLCGLLGRHLTCKRCALTTSFEVAGSGARPTERFALGVGDRYRGVVECCIDVCHAVGDISPYSLFL